MSYYFCFKCTKCGAGKRVISGVPLIACYNCGEWASLIRINPDEYNNLEINEGDV